MRMVLMPRVFREGEAVEYGADPRSSWVVFAPGLAVLNGIVIDEQVGYLPFSGAVLFLWGASFPEIAHLEHGQ